jgi:glycosyltransferase involved in cell wall biosynthesis
VLAETNEATITTAAADGRVPELVIPAARLSTALAAGGHDVTVYTPSTGGDDRVVTAQGYRVIPLPGTSTGPGSGLGVFTEHLERVWSDDRPDLVHAPSWLSGMAAQSAARAQRIPIVQSFTGLAGVPRGTVGVADSDVAERAKLERLLARRADWVAANNTEEMFTLLGMGCARSRVSVVPCGVDIEVFNPAGPVAERGRAAYRIVSVATSTGRFDVETAVRALVALTDTELVFAVDVSTPTAEVAGEVTRLTAAAADAGVADRVTIVEVDTAAELAALLRSADVSACLATTEPTGAAALMAMGCGVPVVATSVGALTDIVVDEVTGRMVPAGDVAGLVEVARRLLHEPFAGRGMGAAGRDRARSRYSWDRVAGDAARAYTGALGSVGVVSA